MDLTTSRPGAPFSTMKQDMPRCARLGGGVGEGEEREGVALAAVGDEHLRAGDEVAVAVAARHRADGLDVGAGVRLGEAEAARARRPLAKRGRRRWRCSSVPWWSTMSAAMVWLLMTPASDIQPRQSSSITRA